jgi:glycosyltransferase involved in cell wall biosynthesis
VIDLLDGCAGRAEIETHLIWSPVRADAEFNEAAARLGAAAAPLPMRRQIHPRDVSAMLAVRKRLLAAGPFDIVHGHSSKGGALARLASAGLGAKVVYSPHAFAGMNTVLPWPRRWAYCALERRLAALTDLVIATSPEERDFAVRIGISENMVTVIPNGIRSEAMTPRAEARRSLGCDSDEEIVVGFVGRLDAQKNPALLVEAFALIAEDFPQARVAMAGEGPLRPRLEALIDRLGLGQRVRMLGWRRGRSLMPGLDVFVLPSRYEGLPYVAMEAVEAGVPLAATASSSVSLLIDEGRNGYITDCDPRSLAEAMARLLADAELRREFGHYSARKILEFTRARMVEATLSNYYQMIDQTEPAAAPTAELANF